MTTDGRRLRGQRSREQILERAVELSSVDGLVGLSLGKLAAAAGVSKSGFFAHWRDKSELQLDAVAWAKRQWVELIVRPALTRPRGVPRLLALHEARLRFYADGVLPGGCFFMVAEAEFDDLSGPVRDAVAVAKREWHDLLRDVAQQAVELGQLPAGTDCDRLAFEINAIGGAVITYSRLLDAETTYEHARRAVQERLS
ncbi:TetR/AcrR family transcriptional regulator [Nonomuraea sp. NPDC050663]|uniref:TetR/AcrR family transcriptional regulator n=1 Tax=Nonomuraea sp. NPDC050663 TaxID=3364370 RepID=UPI0037B8D4A7